MKHPVSSMIVSTIFIAGIVTFSPYTITRLTAQAEGDIASTTPVVGVDSLAAVLPTDIATTTEIASVATTTLDTAIASDTATSTSETTSASSTPSTTPETAATVIATSTPPAIFKDVPTEPEVVPADLTPEMVPIPASVSPLDPAVAPGTATMKIIVKGGDGAHFPIHVTFTAVGGKQTEQTIDSAAGDTFTQELGSGRYYADITTDDPSYALVGDGPHFFINASETKDVGTYILTYRTR
jgi:autotransporter adhesin